MNCTQNDDITTASLRLSDLIITQEYTQESLDAAADLISVYGYDALAKTIRKHTSITATQYDHLVRACMSSSRSAEGTVVDVNKLSRYKINKNHYVFRPNYLKYNCKMINRIFQKYERLARSFTQNSSTRPQELNFCLSLPPRVGKTEIAITMISTLCIFAPRLRIAIVTGNTKLAEDILKSVRNNLRAVGCKFDPADNSARSFRLLSTPKFDTHHCTGFVKAFSVGEIYHGFGCDYLYIDDPYAHHSDALSVRMNETVIDSIVDDALTRLDKSGVYTLCHTRHSKNDVIGYLTSCNDVEWLNAPLLDHSNNNNFKGMYTETRINEIRRRMDIATFEALYQGVPSDTHNRPTVDTHYCYSSVTPVKSYYGLDLAYTQSGGDFSVLTRLVTDKDYPDKVIWDLCLRKQNAAREITIEYSAQINKQKGPVLWYGAGAEKGFVEFFKEKGVDLRFRTAAKNKQSRAANMLEAWQDGRILVAQSKIAQVCLDEVINFTGDPRHHDDVVDALAAAYTLYEEDKARTLNVAQRRDRITRAFGFE